MSEHHAILYRAGHYSEIPELAALDRTSPDVRIIEESPLSIRTVRGLITEAHRRPLQDPVRQFIICARAIAPEAQQALLKILEEPPETTRFSLVLPSDTGLLPTVLSRLSRGKQSGDTPAKASDVFEDFLALPIGERLAAIAARVKAKDDAWVEAILMGVGEYALRAESLLVKRAATLMLAYKDMRGSSKKMLLEHLAFVLPAAKA